MSEVVSNLWQEAAAAAARWHAGHVRKDGCTPYVSHPFRVAMIVRTLFDVHDEAVLCAALLHDVIEDTTADYDDLAEQFSVEIADLVAAVSKDMRQPEPQREEAYDRQLAEADWRARLLKLADVYDNLCDATTEAHRAALLPRAERALALADDDPKLAQASGLVRQLADRVGAK